MSVATSKTWRAEASLSGLRELPQGLDSYFDHLKGFVKRRIPYAKIFLNRADKVLEYDAEYSLLSDDELNTEVDKYKKIFMLGRENLETTHQAIAVIREVCWRTMQMKPYKVQVAGAIAIEMGFIAEMSTGEGKTLTAVMPGILAGWRGKGCHIMTTNSYLAQRDSEEMTPVYNACDVTVSSLKDDMQPLERQQAYMADITYCTNNDVAADFLRDQLELGHGNTGTSELLRTISGIDHGPEKELVLRGLECAIVDEADSVMIDDGVTPLLISGESKCVEKQQMYMQAKDLADLCEEKVHYKVDFSFREIILTAEGKKLLEDECTKLGGVWSGKIRSRELLNQALTVRHFFICDKQYIIDDEKIVIVDEATGRLMPDRFWRSGTHQAVEAKEGVEINPDKETFARISFQKFFRIYNKLSGMTGTGKEATRELWYFYHLPVVPIPTNRPCIRKQEKDLVYINDEKKWDAIIENVMEVHATGRPVLIGTGNILDSQIVSERLDKLELKHQVLNAIYHSQEAEIVSTAGIENQIMVATNMAGRGTDIKLTPKSKELGGLHVVASERFDSYRIDRQLYGRSSRQGDPGSAIAYVSLEDLLLKKYAGLLSRLATFAMKPFLIQGQIRFFGIRALYTYAQFCSVLQGRKQRKGVMKSDDWLASTLGFAGKDN